MDNSPDSVDNFRAQGGATDTAGRNRTQRNTAQNRGAVGSAAPALRTPGGPRRALPPLTERELFLAYGVPVPEEPDLLGLLGHLVLDDDGEWDS